MSEIKLQRYEKNPIISPADNWWETRATFNPGVIKYRDKIVIVYRAIGNDGISRFGYAETKDGINIDKRYSCPILEPSIDDPFERLGIEDPRITKIDGDYHITYTVSSVYEAGHFSAVGSSLKNHPNDVPWRVRGSLVKTKDFIYFERLGKVFGDFDNKDIVLFPEKINGKYFLLDRIHPNITISFSKKIDGDWGEKKILLKPRKGWEEERVGASTVPLKTKKGWLIIYHAADKKQVYRLGFAFLDLNDPSKIIYHHPDPIFEPKEIYEKKGRVPNVVFSCGMVERGSQLYLYYGAADKVIGLATINKKDLLNVL